MTAIQSIARAATPANAAALLAQITPAYKALPKAVIAKSRAQLSDALDADASLFGAAAEAAAYHVVKRLAEGDAGSRKLAAAWQTFADTLATGVVPRTPTAVAISMVASPLKKPKASAPKAAPKPKAAIAPKMDTAALVKAMKAQGLSNDVIVGVLAGM